MKSRLDILGVETGHNTWGCEYLVFVSHVQHYLITTGSGKVKESSNIDVYFILIVRLNKLNGWFHFETSHGIIRKWQSTKGCLADLVQSRPSRTLNSSSLYSRTTAMTDSILAQVYEAVPHITLTMISQGAEALVLSTETHPYYHSQGSCIVKFRPKKPYRHPKIDTFINRSRTIGEAKFMAKLAKVGIPAPSLISLDAKNGVIWMEKIGSNLEDGSISSLKNYLWLLEKTKNNCLSDNVQELCRKTGEVIGQLHMNDMIHGDLTTSNLLLQNNESFLIDFGLSSYSSLPEDKAVDLYVLERAVTSTHSDYAEQYNSWLLEGYRRFVSEHKSQGKSKLKETMRKLEEVRLRGRKRSMLG